MSKTQYSKKFGYTGLSFKKSTILKEDIGNDTDLRITKKTKTSKNSWKTFINLKKVKITFNKNDSFSSTKILRSRNLIPIMNQMSIIQYNKAPSLKENQKDIIKFIKKKKLKTKNEIDNLYNSILINESKLFRTNLYITQSEHQLMHSNSNSNFINKNNKKIFLSNKNKKNINNNNEITGSTSIEGLKYNLDSVTNKNEREIVFPSLKNNKSNSTLNAKKINHNLFFKTFYKRKKSESEWTRSQRSNDYSRIRMEINEAIFNTLKNKNDYSEFGKKMMKFKVISNIQNSKLKNILSKEEYNYDKKYNKLINLKNLGESAYITFSEKINGYLKFLYDIIRQYNNELSIYDRQIKEIDDKLEIIILDIVQNQADLEYLVERRNFLLLIKQKFGNPPSYYEELLIKDSKKLLVGDAIYNLKVTKLIKNKSVMVFNNSYLEVKEKIKNNLLNIGHIQNNSDDIITNNQLFANIDEFIQQYKSLENKNLKYLKEKDNAEKQIDKLKEQYDEEIILNHDYIETEIKNKEKELEKIITKNNILVRTYKYYEENILKNSNNKKNISYKVNDKNSKEKLSSIDIACLKKYRAQLEKYKYDGLLLLQKLIELLKNLSHIKYGKSHYFSEFFNDKNLKSLLNLNLNKYNSDKIYLINNYIITLISKFEIICKYIINRNDIYIHYEKNKEYIKEKQIQLTFQKKKENAEELRIIINDKKYEEMKKIVEKSKKISLYIPNKICPENSVKRNKAMKKMKKRILDDYKNNNLENDFNNFVNYDDNF